MIEVEEDDDPEEWKESQNRLSFIIENILRKKTRSTQHEETQEKFFLSLIPEIVKDVASNFPPEEKRPREIRDAIYYERKEAGKFLLEQYPLAAYYVIFQKHLPTLFVHIFYKYQLFFSE